MHFCWHIRLYVPQQLPWRETSNLKGHGCQEAEVTYNKGKGKCIAWIRAHLDYQGDECLPWPFSRQPSGYGSFGYLGKLHYAHRFICEATHGPPPSPKHHAAHSVCWRGQEGCVNNRHITWQTPSENAIDRGKFGFKSRPIGTVTHLTKEQIHDIRTSGLTVFALMDKHNITRGIVRYWRDTSHEPNQYSNSTQAIKRRARRSRQAQNNIAPI